MKAIQCSLYFVKWQQVARELINSRKRALFVRSFLLYYPVLNARGVVNCCKMPKEIARGCEQEGRLRRASFLVEGTA